MKRTVSARRISIDRGRNGARRRADYVICVRNDENPASLQLMKVYRRLPDPDAERHHMWRVIDEDREDYLFPAAYFIPVTLPRAAIRALTALGK